MDDLFNTIELFKKADNHVWSNIHMDAKELKAVCQKQQKRAKVIAEQLFKMARQYESYAINYEKTIMEHRQVDEQLSELHQSPE
jgi:hypothetical protein